jgi:transcriptional regulator with XRE-family HTH domain
MQTTMRFNGAALRAWRAARGLTGEALAEAAGMKSQGHIASLESGKKQPSWPTIEALSNVLAIPPVALVTSGESPNAESWPFKSGRRADLEKTTAA